MMPMENRIGTMLRITGSKYLSKCLPRYTKFVRNSKSSETRASYYTILMMPLAARYWLDKNIRKFEVVY